ncbi:MAG: TraC family protein [Peptococcaceae bacterium]|nr:TraC family protein [Peptococcaceae bacterium]
MGVISLPFLGRFRAKKKDTEEQAADVQQELRQQMVSQWLPFKDIHNSVIERKDGTLVAVLRVMPYNLNLASDNEKRRIIGAVHEALNGQQEPFQILCLPRPVDLDAYLQNLESMAQEIIANLPRKRLLQNYLRYVGSLVAGGQAMERRYYVLLPHRKGNDAFEEVLQRAHELASSLQRAGLRVSVCDDQEIIDLIFCFTHPAQAAFERPPGIEPTITTVTTN